jgi:hypothetical protein
MLFIFSTPVLIRHLCQLKIVDFLHRCLIHDVLLFQVWRKPVFCVCSVLYFHLSDYIFMSLIFIDDQQVRLSVINWLINLFLASLNFLFRQLKVELVAGVSQRVLRHAFLDVLQIKKTHLYYCKSLANFS